MTTPRRPFARLFAVLFAALLLPVGSPSAQADGENPRVNRVVRVVRSARSAVVLIRTPRIRSNRGWFPFPMSPYPQKETSLGSGTLFHPAGFVITNAHVISQAESILVDVPQGNGTEVKEYEAVALAVDIPNDLAILRLLTPKGEEPDRFAHIPLGRSGDLMLGETVITLGHPLRLGITVTRGIISGLGRTLRMKGGYRFDDFIQVDASVNLGNSGGPLFDVTGRWIGVNTAIYKRGYASTAEGIGFAIPIDRVRSLIAKAFKRRMVTGHWFGLDFVEGGGEVAQLHRVYPKGPARESPLRPGDVITHLNGTPTPTLFDLRMEMATLPLASTVRVRVEREGEPLDAPVELEDKPLPTGLLAWRHLGFRFDDAEVNGVLLTEVRAAGPADQVHLTPGDVIEGLGPFKISNSDDLLRFLQVVEKGDTFQVRIKRLERVGTRMRLARMRGTMQAQ